MAVESNDSPKHSRRMYVLWGTAFSFLSVVGLMYWMLVVPVLRVRPVVAGLHSAVNDPMFSKPAGKWAFDVRRQVESTGGVRRAATGLRLYSHLPDSYGPHKAEAAFLLEWCQNPHASTLLDAMTRGDWTYRKRATACLAGVEYEVHEVLRETIAMCLTNPDATVRKSLAVVLNRVDPAAHECIDEVHRAVREQTLAQRCGEEYVSGQFKTLNAVTVAKLSGLLGSQNAHVRWFAAHTLSRSGENGEGALRALTVALEDSDESVRRWARRAIRNIRGNPASFKALTATLSGSGSAQDRADAARRLGRLGDSGATDPLIAALKDREEAVRAEAARGLQILGDPRASKALADQLAHDESWKARVAAARALGLTGGPDALPALMAALDLEPFEVRRAAAEALDDLSDRRAVTRLITLVGSSDVWEIRAAAAIALGRMKARGAVESLVEAMQFGESHKLRPFAAQALGDIGDPAALPALQEALQENHTILQKEARRAIQKIRDAQQQDLESPAEP